MRQIWQTKDLEVFQEKNDARDHEDTLFNNWKEGHLDEITVRQLLDEASTESLRTEHCLLSSKTLLYRVIRDYFDKTVILQSTT